MGIYIGQLIVDPTIVSKLNTKHQVTEVEVREAFQWPARVEVGLEVHPEHGLRWVALGSTAAGREIIAWLLPTPDWAGDLADTWVVKSARWVGIG